MLCATAYQTFAIAIIPGALPRRKLIFFSFWKRGHKSYCCERSDSQLCTDDMRVTVKGRAVLRKRRSPGDTSCLCYVDHFQARYGQV